MSRGRRNGEEERKQENRERPRGAGREEETGCTDGYEETNFRMKKGSRIAIRGRVGKKIKEIEKCMKQTGKGEIQKAERKKVGKKRMQGINREP